MAQAISEFCKLVSKSSKRRWEVIKWILWKLKIKTCYGITFNRGQGDPIVVGYDDSKYVGYINYIRYITRDVFNFSGRPI